MKKFETYSFFCTVLGTLVFWVLIAYRLINEGFAWLYTTSDGIIIAGVIGIAGFVMMIADDALKGDLPLSKAFERELDFRFALLNDKLDSEFRTLEHELKIKTEEVTEQLKYVEVAITDVRDHLFASESD
ncbi:hypothetical protein AB3G45_19725 [Shinella sp. S4-D37]|uniref:hypothetical protein n=1 Tax=Shinella sp. S4-D37 TaxID=3161999 RepID=UPI00346659EF